MLLGVLSYTRRRLRGTRLGRLTASAGLTRIGKSLYLRQVIRRGRYQAVVLGQPLCFAVDSPVEIQRVDSLVNEEEFVRRLLAALRPGDVFYDVGANIGLISLLAAASTAVTVHAFEPEPRNARHLRANAALNHLANLHVHELGLADREGTADLYVGGETGEGTHSMLAVSAVNRRAVKIPVMTGDRFSQQSNPIPDVVKIDVEGAEMDVLRGMDSLLRRQAIRDLFIEIHPDRLASTGWNTHALLEWMRDRNYHSVWSQPRGEEIHHHLRRNSDF